MLILSALWGNHQKVKSSGRILLRTTMSDFSKHTGVKEGGES